MADSQDVDIGRATGIYPLPDALSPGLKADLAIRQAKEEVASLPRSTTGTSPAEAAFSRLAMTRPVSDQEYDQMVRHNALIKRLQAIENENRHGYDDARTAYGYPHRFDLRQINRPAVRHRPVNVLDYPGGMVSEPWKWWDATTSSVYNAARMAGGDETAADDFAENANTLLLGVPRFMREGTFHPERDEYENDLGYTHWDSPLMMAVGYADNYSLQPYSRDPGSTGFADVATSMGVPGGTATDVAGLVVDSLLDPDAAAIRGIRALRSGLPAKAAMEFGVDAGPVAGLYGWSRYQGSGPWSSEPQ